jgi:hypothetical protein
VFWTIFVFYAVLGLWVLKPEAIYSGDIGVKYVQARALASHRYTSLDIPYPGEFLDPSRQFFPIRPPFVMTAGDATQAIFSPASALLQAAAARAADIHGLILISILSAAAILWAAWCLTPMPYRAAALVALGLGGPLWFYAVSGTEHASAVAFSTAAFVIVFRSTSAAAPVIAGLLLGAAAALRDEALLLLPGLLFTAWLSGRNSWRLPGLVGGVIVPLAAAAAVEVWWFERPAAAHLRHAAHFVQSALQVASSPNLEVPVLQPFTLADRWETVVNYWLFGTGDNHAIAAMVLSLGIALLMQWKWRTPIATVLWIGIVVMIAIIDLHEVLTAPKWLAGLFRVAPYLALAFLPPPPRSAGPWPRIALIATAAYLLVAFIGVDTTGGKSLGPRLLLPLVPLLTVAAIIRTGQYLTGPARMDQLVGTAGVLLVVIAVIFHLGGTIRAYHWRNQEDSSSVLTVAAASDRIVVADDQFTAQLLFPLYFRKIILLADSPGRAARVGMMLSHQRVPGAILVSRNPQARVGLAPLRLARTEQQGRMLIQYWRR